MKHMDAGQFYQYDEATGIPIYSNKTHFIKKSVRQTLCGIAIPKVVAIDYASEVHVDCKRCLKKSAKP